MNIVEFLNSEIKNANITEHRGKSKAQLEKEAEETKNLELKDVEGKDAEDNMSEGVWGVDEPTEDDLLNGVDKTLLNRNAKRILMRLKSKKPFFIQGEAGWGKTSLIVKLANQTKRTVITVYLDKAEATDLAGIPVPAKSKNGADYVKNLLPGWAKIMYDNPDKQFLLFFDEMNQAAPDVMNALMPIVLKNVVCGHVFKNFIVGAAGNFEDENEGGISELSKPLLSRFGGIIKWESGDWDNAFKFLHKKWDEKVGKGLIDKIQAYPELFNNPRDIENHVIEAIYNMKEDGDIEDFEASDYLENLQDIAKNDLNRSEQKTLEELADYIYDFLNNKASKDEKEENNSRKGRDMIPQVAKDIVKNSMQQGYFELEGDDHKYGASEDTIKAILSDICNAEQVENLIDAYTEDGLKWKYKTADEWKKSGKNFTDPLEFGVKLTKKSLIKQIKEEPKKTKAVKKED